MTSSFFKYTSKEELNLKLALGIQSILLEAIKTKGEASIAFSGGSTPIAMFEKLSQLDIDWPKVKITLVDDRWVPENNAASNAGCLKKYLFKQNCKPQFFPLVADVENRSAFEAEEEINRQLEESLQSLDLAILGMGNDGHTASFFPGSPQLEKALDLNGSKVCLATKPTNAEHDRMTLSLSYLLKSQQLILHFTGKEKYQVYLQAINSGLDLQLPVSYVLHKIPGSNVSLEKGFPLKIYYAD